MENATLGKVIVSAKVENLFDLYDVARIIETSSWQVEEWIKDDECATPKPTFRNGRDLYWSENAVEEFKAVLAAKREAEAARTFTRAEIADLAVKRIEMEACVYTTSKIGYRDAFNRAEAVYMFANNIGTMAVMPKETRDAMMEIIWDLKDKAGLK